MSPFGGQVQGGAHPRLLLAQRVGVQGLAPGQRSQEVEIEPVADQIVGPADLGLDLRRAPGGVARAGSDHSQPAARPADRRGVERRRRPRDGAGRPLRFPFRHDERAFGPGGGQGRPLGHAGHPDLAPHQLRRVGQPVGLRRQGLLVEEPRRHPQRPGGGVDRRLVGLEVDRDQGGHRARRQSGLRQALLDQRDDVPGIAVPFAADADGQHRRMVDETIRRARIGRLGDPDLQRPGVGNRQGGLGQPGRLTHNPNLGTGKKFRCKPFVIALIS